MRYRYGKLRRSPMYSSCDSRVRQPDMCSPPPAAEGRTTFPVRSAAKNLFRELGALELTKYLAEDLLFLAVRPVFISTHPGL
jgi:hypothetical protein